jgi:hypothetical protein
MRVRNKTYGDRVIGYAKGRDAAVPCTFPPVPASWPRGFAASGVTLKTWWHFGKMIEGAIVERTARSRLVSSGTSPSEACVFRFGEPHLYTVAIVDETCPIIRSQNKHGNEAHLAIL